MKLRTVVGFAAGAALGLTACSLLEKYQGSQAQLTFSHALHKAKDVDCGTCHEAVYEAADLTGSFLPKEKVCLGCHKEWKASGDCGKCHANAQKPRTYLARTAQLVFDHAAHLERVPDENCGVCHVSLHEPKDRERNPPPMDTCLGCHPHQADYDAGRCDKCHVDLKTRPLRFVSDFSHRGDWLKRHSVDARAAEQTCWNCHDQFFCSDCHNARTVSMTAWAKYPERADREFIHRADFLSRHMVEQVEDPVSCQRCHAGRFCEDCHTRNNLTPAGTSPRDPHPAGWSFPGPNNHGSAARSNIASCAACHDRGAHSICVDCHKVGGIGGTPHPRGWTDNHTENPQRTGMCAACHNQ